MPGSHKPQGRLTIEHLQPALEEDSPGPIVAGWELVIAEWALHIDDNPAELVDDLPEASEADQRVVVDGHPEETLNGLPEKRRPTTFLLELSDLECRVDPLKPISRDVDPEVAREREDPS